MTIRDRVVRANPQVSNPTYRYLKGEIDRREYDRLLAVERSRHPRPAGGPDYGRRQAASDK